MGYAAHKLAKKKWGYKMNKLNKKNIPVIGFSAVLLTLGLLAGCGEASNVRASPSTVPEIEATAESTAVPSTEPEKAETTTSDDEDEETSSYSNSNYNSSSSNYNSSENEYSYDPDDKYYSSHDYDGDGKISDSEFGDALNDYIDDKYNQYYGADDQYTPGEDGYDMPDVGESFSDYVKRVDPELYDSLSGY